MGEKKNTVQLVWGIALVLMGIGVFYRIPQVMPRISGYEQSSIQMMFIRFCFYMVGAMLLGGGARKLYHIFQKDPDEDSTR
jgi:Ni,Fe-hydrogenase I cytochrome b subunit